MDGTANKDEVKVDTRVESAFEEITDVHAEHNHGPQQNKNDFKSTFISVDSETGTPSPIKSLLNKDKLQESKINVHYNHKGLSKQATTYELEKFKKNYMVIFNQIEILNFEPRLGTNEDVQVLANTFRNFGFEIEKVLNPTKKRIFEVLDTFKTKNFTDYGCICVVVLTHGVVDGGLWAKDQVYNEQEVIDYFDVHNNQTLFTKPKIFIIQACRGSKYIPAANVWKPQSLTGYVPENTVPYNISVPIDTLVIHSTYKGEPSVRDSVEGSWLIQTICKKIKEHATSEDFEHILMKVNREIAFNKSWIEFDDGTGEYFACKQMPTVTSTLTRQLYLNRFQDVPKIQILKQGYPSKNVMNPRSQHGPFSSCSCFLDQFSYIKKCLMYFLEENPHDTTAESFLLIANTFSDGNAFNEAKIKMGKIICQHLKDHARQCSFIKYMYFNDALLNHITY